MLLYSQPLNYIYIMIYAVDPENLQLVAKGNYMRILLAIILHPHHQHNCTF
jgi:hypothetical protein